MKQKHAAQLVFAALWLLVSWRSYATEPLAFGDVACEGDYQHHLQGVCTNESDAIYWSFTTELVKTDRQGKVLTKIQVANHHGDLCFHEGKIYVAVNLGKFNDPQGNADSWVYVYDAENLKPIAKHETQEVFHGAGGIGVMNGRFYVVGGLPDGFEDNYVYEYDAALKFVKKHVVKSGWTRLGIQTATFHDDAWWFGCYGSPPIMLTTDDQFNVLGRYEFDCSLGIVGVAKDRLLVANGPRTDKGRCLGTLHLARPDKQRGLLELATESTDPGSLRLAAFQVDATPPLGSPLCNGAVKPAMEIVSPLTARGVVLLGADEPIVLCAVDWVGIGNESYDAFRVALAKAVGTTADHVTLHTLHQHDAPGSDFATERLLAEHGLAGQFSNADFDAQVMQRLADAAKQSLATARNVTHVGFGSANVEKVASNRRILGADGRVAIQRQSSGGRNPAAAAAPEGTIDPLLRLVSFWQADTPLGVLTYYATHPQSYYGQGSVNWDFVGMARAAREEALPGVPHVHFDGAGGNVAAGKYNDGSQENRPLLAGRLADGMRRAWESQEKTPIAASDVTWHVQGVTLPVRRTLVEAELLEKLANEVNPKKDRLRAARDLVFVRRMNHSHRIPLSCLALGSARILHMPGELFVEYQLAAQQMRPGEFVAMAAYGDYGPGYIGTKVAYSQGGYETGIVSRVAPEVESVLTEAMNQLLSVEP